MTRLETQAYNDGVEAVLALARGAADRLAPKFPDRPALAIAISTLDSVAEEGVRLLQPMPQEAPADV